ncbi:MAG TPA: FAD-dependent monooxygenase [Pyrinomonadaceae bacterium]|nr:FAD-dependent monooxygenase [Pyrinomonadaceae bacterium]
MNQPKTFDVIIAGGGPAGASAAIHLAIGGARVLLAEQKRFPRPKLCGEFISPECALHFDRLGVKEQMLAAGPATLAETVFYSRNGSKVSVPSSWFGSGGVALGLSRAEMDERLLRRAHAAGAQVLEDAHVTDLVLEKGQVQGVTIKAGSHAEIYRAAITIDATGRARALARRLPAAKENAKLKRPPMIAFKAHLENVRVAPGVCEIYFYRRGYGGLSSIENGLSNLCFIASARDVRSCASDADRVMREVVSQNRRARFTLEGARTHSQWLAVSLDGFGRQDVAPADGLLTVGDAASFIDPFTGSGMLMALESGELAARAIGNYLDADTGTLRVADLRLKYTAAYHRFFASRLNVCSLLRKAAFVPGFAELAIRFFGANEQIRRRLARATRGPASETYSLAERVR